MSDTETVRLLVASDQLDAIIDYVLHEVQGLDPERGVVLILLSSVTESESDIKARLSSLRAETAVVPVSEIDEARVGAAVREHEATQVLLGPETGIDPPQLGREFGVPVEVVPVPRSFERRQLSHRRGVRRFVGVFVLSYAFYLFLGNPLDPFDLITGVISAGVVAVALSSTVFEEEPAVRRTSGRLLRSTLFLPYLLYEVIHANLAVTRVILDPDLPIDPRLVELDPETDDRFHRTVLANAITLTPGSLTVDVDEGGFVVHTLTTASRRGLESGSLQRAVDFVFHGWDR